ncbi:Rieske 2Fe-2S domain-containing protein [Plantactinospora sp. BB1]|uniref:Rieske 2Fe-2S domain-containing protein n=1 Tax=Plantactinospora sp. BB1 TaxID=2071627 RepID=UPI000D1713EC|nr:Rieske 2Fe-2S domain-containing protein [Plantactinospora sp. BB1]AVT40191.1 (2Fe-2S)-binding protein [Plantactinospora sp. BB1]
MRAILKLEQATGLDRTAERMQRVVAAAIRPQWLRDLLHGVPIGHPLHPALVQVPIGAWMSTAVLDLMPNQRRAATTLVAVGTAVAVPTAISGWNDWGALSREQQRVGLVHALANGVAIAMYAGSLAARLSGRPGLGRTLGYLGLAAAGSGGFIGGHLAYKQAANVNQGVPDLRRIEDGWHALADMSALPEKELLTRRIDDIAVIVYRQGDDVTVMLERCAHQSGPLGAGEVVQENGRTCVKCPWHGSMFELDGGEVVHGPASTDQQVLPTRVVGGVLQTRLP